MSFISRSDDVFRRLISRFDLETLNREKVVIPSSIQPVTMVDPLLITLLHIQKIIGTRTYTLDEFPVPVGKRWHIISYGQTRAQTGALDVLIYDPAGDSIVIDSMATGTSHSKVLATPIMLDHGWILQLNGGAGTDGSIISKVLVLEEDTY